MTDREEIKSKLRANFDGKVVRKDLTNKKNADIIIRIDRRNEP